MLRYSTKNHVEKSTAKTMNNLRESMLNRKPVTPLGNAISSFDFVS